MASDAQWQKLVQALEVFKNQRHDLETILYTRGIDFRRRTNYRSGVEQNRLYAQGRTTPGNIVTNAPSGQSPHQFGLAQDYVIFRSGHLITSDKDPAWTKFVQAVKACNLKSGANFKGLRDMGHVEYPTWRSVARPFVPK